MKWEVFNRKIMNMLFFKIGVEPETDEDRDEHQVQMKIL